MVVVGVDSVCGGDMVDVNVVVSVDSVTGMFSNQIKTSWKI